MVLGLVRGARHSSAAGLMHAVLLVRLATRVRGGAVAADGARALSEACADENAFELDLRAGTPLAHGADGSGGKEIWFVRHAEGWHNKHSRELPNWKAEGLSLTDAYWDARLTPLGEEQCATLAERIAERDAADMPVLIAVSPLTRTLQTATLVFGNGSAPFVATELARERIAAHTCDGRRDKSALAAEFPAVDLREVHVTATKQNLIPEFRS